MTLGTALGSGARRLKAVGIPHPAYDALLLLAHALGRDKAWVLAHRDAPLPRGEGGIFEALLHRREAREPLQHLRGFQEFWGLRVRVGPGCLIPRPETEHLVEQSLLCLGEEPAPRVLEVGVGSGCVLAALAREHPGAVLWGAEREREALAWARRNLAAAARARLVRADLEGPCPFAGLDLLVSNPPYITAKEWPSLPPEVRDHEPRAALLIPSGDPLGPYRHLGRWAEQALRPGGHLVAELGVAQARRARSLRRLSPSLRWLRGVRDLAGRLRVAVWQKL